MLALYIGKARVPNSRFHDYHLYFWISEKKMLSLGAMDFKSLMVLFAYILIDYFLLLKI